MNDFSELEMELKQLRPVQPSAELRARIEMALAESATATAGILPRRNRWQTSWFGWGLGVNAAAAALLLFARANLDRPKPAPSTNVASASPPALKSVPPAARTFQPDGVTRVVYDVSNEGLVYPANSSEPARRLRSRSRETLHWKNPESGASLRVSYPTEVVELVPVSLSGQ